MHMASTRSQKLRQVAADEAAERIPLDASEIVHSFEDGWTVRKLTCTGDLRREGWLMHSCLAQYVGDVLCGRRKGASTVMFGHDRHRFDWSEREPSDFTGPHSKWPANALCNLYSLRDKDNLPHATWWSRPGVYSHSVLGAHNEQVKPSYRKRIDEWLKVVPTIELPEALVGLSMRDRRHQALRAKANAESVTDSLRSVIEACELMLIVRLQLEINNEDERAAKLDEAIEACLADLGIRDWQASVLQQVASLQSVLELTQLAA
jgi:hypothetical protein